MSDLDLSALERAADAATEGEWYVGLPDGDFAPQHLFAGRRSLFLRTEGTLADLDFIAAANPSAVKAWLVRDRALVAALEEANARGDAWRDKFNEDTDTLAALLAALGEIAAWDDCPDDCTDHGAEAHVEMAVVANKARLALSEYRSSGEQK